MSADSKHSKPVAAAAAAAAGDAVDAELAAAGYGYGGTIDALRDTHFKRLKGDTYLDHGGATLYSELQVNAALGGELTATLYANPHSASAASMRTRDMLDRMRDRVLAFFGTNAKEYAVIFTGGATGALKLLGESFPWSGPTASGSVSEFCYTLDNHNSVLGIREYAKANGAVFSCVDSGTLNCVCSESMKTRLAHAIQAATTTAGSAKPNTSAAAASTQPVYSLFAFPAESNFSGLQYDLQLIELAKTGAFGHNPTPTAQWKVVVDAAKYCATHRLDLGALSARAADGKAAPDFVCVSFYKLFGWPTGLGALLVRADSAPLLRKNYYFSGGTVEASVSNDDFVRLRGGGGSGGSKPAVASLHERFEDGTINFLSIAGLAPGFDLLERTLTLPRIAAHTRALHTYLLKRMLGLKHANGAPVVRVYGSPPTDPTASAKPDAKSSAIASRVAALKHEPGPTVAFNVLKADGAFVGYSEVDRLAAGSGIQLRTGCFCNPGACQYYLSLSASTVRAHAEAGHVCWDDHDLIDGQPTGAVRVSLGWMSTRADADTFIRFMTRYFVDTATAAKPVVTPNGAAADSKSSALSTGSASAGVRLAGITLYPIKSCAGQNVSEWTLGDRGLLYDREWTIVTPSGVALSQKTVPKMCLIQPTVDTVKRTLTIEAPDMPTLVLPLDVTTASGDKKEESTLHVGANASDACQLDVCGTKVSGLMYSDAAITEWLTQFLNRPCALARAGAGGGGKTGRKMKWRQATESKSADKKQTLVAATGTAASNTAPLATAAAAAAAAGPVIPIGFANDGQYLLIAEQSVSTLAGWALADTESASDGTASYVDDELGTIKPNRFRPNFVVSGTSAAFDEDEWKAISIQPAAVTAGASGIRMDVVGASTRCVMINIDQHTGCVHPALFRSLATKRRRGGQIVFGILLAHQPTPSTATTAAPLTLRVGDIIIPRRRAD